MLKEATLISRINSLLPGAKATSIHEWDGRNTPGIWLRGSENVVDGIPIYDYYCDIGDDVHPKLQNLLSKAGWMAEPYDSGTLMLFPA